MSVTKEELHKIVQYNTLSNASTKLSKEQLEFIIDRKLTDISWQKYAYPKQQTNKPKKPAKLPKPKPKFKPKFSFSDIAKQAAVKAQRRINRNEEPDTYKITKLFRNNVNNYRIVKERDYTYDRFNAARSEWKIYGDVDIFQIQEVIYNLVNRMVEGLPENVRLQIMLRNNNNDRRIQTGVIIKNEMIARLADWVNLFVDYYDMNIEDLTFVLTAIEVPAGAGKRVNSIITVDSKRSIIKVENNDTTCLARCIIVGLAVNNREKLESIFKGKLSVNDCDHLNKSSQTKTNIHNGKISDNEITYIKKGRKTQEVLAYALHRISNVKVTDYGNSFEDVKLFEEYLNIQIQIYNLESRQIYKGHEKPIKIYILLSEKHYDVISNIDGFTCANASHHKAENGRCKMCNAPSKCDFNLSKITCKYCNKEFYGPICFQNHITNKRCLDHSYKCIVCDRVYHTRELKISEH